MSTPMPTPIIRRLAPGDEGALVAFYNQRNVASKRTFRPLGPVALPEVCTAIIDANAPGVGTKFDLVAIYDGDRQAETRQTGGIVGWSFLWKLDTDEPTFGLAVADAFHGQGLGTALMARMMQTAREMRLPTVYLIVVTDNTVALRLYEKQGFVIYDKFTSDDGLPYFRMAFDVYKAE
jgi:RimJ/RimL family protein N-acetyltransferase